MSYADNEIEEYAHNEGAETTTQHVREGVPKFG